jgi:hypothetical protein
MRKQPDNRLRPKPSRWRRAGLVAAAGMLSLAGCNSLDSGTTAAGPDPFLGPGIAPPPKLVASTVQPPPGAVITAPAVSTASATPPPGYSAGVLPAAPAPNPTVSVAALAPTSVHPLSDREELRIGSPRNLNGEGWSPTSATTVATTGTKATLTPPETNGAPIRTPAPAVLTQNTSPAPSSQSAPPTQPAPSPSQEPVTTVRGPASVPSADDRPTTIEAAAELLKKKGAVWQLPNQSGETGECLFRCGVANPKTNKIRTYEARSNDQLSAMLLVLDQINRAQ